MKRLEVMTNHERESYEELTKTKDHVVNSFSMLSLKVDEISRAVNEIQEALLAKGIMRLGEKSL